MAGLNSKMQTEERAKEQAQLQAAEKTREKELETALKLAAQNLAAYRSKKAEPLPVGAVVPLPVGAVNLKEVETEAQTGGASASSSSLVPPFGRPGDGDEAAVPPMRLASGDKIESWPRPPCVMCCVIGESYKRMAQEKFWVEVLDDDGLENYEDGYFRIEYTCVGCAKEKWGLATEGEAYSRIKAEGPGLEKSKKRAAVFRAAEERHKEDAAAEG